MTEHTVDGYREDRREGKALYPVVGPVGRWVLNALDTREFCKIVLAVEHHATTARRADTCSMLVRARADLRKSWNLSRALLLIAPELVRGKVA